MAERRAEGRSVEVALRCMSHRITREIHCAITPNRNPRDPFEGSLRSALDAHRRFGSGPAVVPPDVWDGQQMLAVWPLHAGQRTPHRHSMNVRHRARICRITTSGVMMSDSWATSSWSPRTSRSSAALDIVPGGAVA